MIYDGEQFYVRESSKNRAQWANKAGASAFNGFSAEYFVIKLRPALF